MAASRAETGSQGGGAGRKRKMNSSALDMHGVEATTLL